MQGTMSERLLAAVVKRGYFWRYWYPRYNLMYSSRQLRFLLDCIDETAEVDGAVVEVGCAYGMTTTFLYEYLRDSGIRKDYFCIDTFSGFTSADIAYEREIRKKRFFYEAYFGNKVEWFKENLLRRGINDIKIIQADIGEIDPDDLPRIAFCLLDVDLYRPVAGGLDKIFPRLNSGGMIVVDDCWAEKEHAFNPLVPEMFDGALGAYRGFLGRVNLPEEIVERKLGVIRKE